MDIQQLEQDAYNLGILAGQSPAQQEAYTWYVDYSDDRPGFHEIAAHNFAEVDHSCVKALFLLPLQGGAAHRVDIPRGAQAVFFRRRSIEVNLLSEQTGNHTTTHCIGWKKAGEAVYLFVFDDGSTLLTTDLQAV